MILVWAVAFRGRNMEVRNLGGTTDTSDWTFVFGGLREWILTYGFGMKVCIIRLLSRFLDLYLGLGVPGIEIYRSRLVVE